MDATYTIDGSVATIRLDDGRANAMRTEGLETIGSFLDRANPDGATAIVFEGREGLFSAGLDLKWLPTLDAEGVSDLVTVFSSTMLRVLSSPIPTIGLLTGHAIAGGAMLACACDHRIGVRGGYRLQMNEVAIGIPMPSWMTVIARSAIPAPQLFDVLQLARPLGFDEALRLGTLHAMADDIPHLEQLGASSAAELGRLDPSAFAETKRRLWKPAIDEAEARLAHE